MSGELPFVEFTEFITGGINAGEYVDFDDRADIKFELNGKRIILSVFANSLDKDSGGENEEGRFEDQFILDLAEAADVAMDGMEECEPLIDDIAMTIMEIGEVPFAEIAPPLTVPYFPPTDLHSTLYPKEYDYRIQTIDGKPVIFPISPDQAAYVRKEYVPDPNFIYEPPAGLSLPRYLSKDIMIEEENLGGIFSAAKARVGSRILFCKAFAGGINHSNLDKEVETHHKIHQACIKAGVQIQIPQLRGLIVHADSGAVIGFLRDFIEPGPYGGTLSEIRLRTVPEKLRQKWLLQISETMGFLHSFGLFWGDGKAANVVIDPNNDAWLIDLAGGWTNGWVHKNHTGTMEGENQALRRMTAYLGFPI
ncbi:hypothetical protein CDV31_014163 [Fusarium ambrosium]|uniref:Protein kinase domain-containing protein n=1 Tax=Fusarium ambrosium TaxID=131363 RepID=A0A428SYC9_9HYPO|nr:hypothetical protein CDV31_014163 [Fusarium ambrosium]